MPCTDWHREVLSARMIDYLQTMYESESRDLVNFGKYIITFRISETMQDIET